MNETMAGDGSPRVAVLGSGILTAAGRGTRATLDALRSGGASPHAPRTIATELEGGPPVFEVADESLRGFAGRLPGGRGRRSMRLTIVAATEAVEEARHRGLADFGPERVAVVVGATVGGMNHGELWIESRCAARRGKPARPVSARSAMRHMPLWEMPSALAASFGFAGPTFAVSTACTSGSQAIAVAAELIVSGACDAVLAGGVDCLSRLTYHGFATLGVTSPRRCTPFDARRSGLNLGEGAAFVVLAREDLVAGVGHARLAGWSANTDAHHMTAPRPDGSGVSAAMGSALALAGLDPREVGWVHAHGTATAANDSIESCGIRAVFGAHRVPVSSTKHLFGHTLGAAGAVGSVVALLALREGFVPGNAPVESRDPACDVDVVPPDGIGGTPRHVVVGSLGFGGASCALVFSGTAR